MNVYKFSHCLVEGMLIFITGELEVAFCFLIYYFFLFMWGGGGGRNLCPLNKSPFFMEFWNVFNKGKGGSL